MTGCVPRRPSTWGAAGGLLLLAFVIFAVLASVAAALPATYGFMNQIGGPGSTPGTFGTDYFGPFGVECDSSGTLYIADALHPPEIKVFLADGTFVRSFALGAGANPAQGRVQAAYSLAIDGTTVYALDRWRQNDYRIQAFDTTGASTGQIATPEIAAGEAQNIAVDGSHNIYVSQWANGTIACVRKYSPTGSLLATIGSIAAGPDHLDQPKGLDVDASGAVYVADGAGVAKFTTANGTTYTKATTFTAPGTGFTAASSVARDSAGNIFVTDSGADRVVKMNASGTVLTTFGSRGTGPGQTQDVSDVAVDAHGNVFLADPSSQWDTTTNNRRVLRFAPDLTAPTTTLTGLVPSDGRPLTNGWTRAASVTVSLSAADPMVANEYTSGVDVTQVSTDGGTVWSTYLPPFVVSAQGTTFVKYRSEDAADNSETAKTVEVRIDRTKPVPKAIKNMTVTRGRKVSLPFSVADAPTPTVNVTIVVKKGSKTLKTFRLSNRATGKTLACPYTCTLPKGLYTWSVSAKDPAGNVQARTSTKYLTVK